MKFLANENFPLDAVEAVRKIGRLMERKWWSDHRNPLAARVPETAAVERQDPVRGGLRS
ncbi:MAG: hypothetical protein ACLQU5_10510 [Isosphaeraceae bacterium]